MSLSVRTEIKGGGNETDSAQGAERGRRDADRTGRAGREGGSVYELDELLWEAGVLVVRQALERKGCDALVRDMRASASRPSEPLHTLTGRREPTDDARQRVHAIGSPWPSVIRILLGLDYDDAIREFLGEPYVPDMRVLFLSYPPGGLIAPHRDEHERELATAVFVLNDDFEGGEFVVHEHDRDLQLNVEPGTLIVFRSGVLHSVREVTSGTRFSVAGSLMKRDA